MQTDYVQFKNELRHYGVLGMKWGHRRFQNEDGTLTPAGSTRYSERDASTVKLESVNKSVSNINKWRKDDRGVYKNRRKELRAKYKEGGSKEDFEKDKAIEKENFKAQAKKTKLMTSMQEGKTKTSSILGGIIGGSVVSSLGKAMIISGRATGDRLMTSIGMLASIQGDITTFKSGVMGIRKMINEK